MKLFVSLGLCLPLLLGGAAARAEEQPAATAGAAQSDTQTPAVHPGLGLIVVPAWQNDDVTGSDNRYQKYVTPPHAGFIDAVHYQALTGAFPYLRFDATRLGQPGSTAALRWEDPFPRAFAEVDTDRYRFYLYPDADGSSLRQNWRFAAGSQLGDGNTYLSLGARLTDLHIAKPSGMAIDWSTSNAVLGATRQLRGGDVDAAVSLRRFESHTADLPTTDMIRYGLGYERALGGLGTLGLNYNLASTHVFGENPTIGVVSLSAVSPVTAGLVATLNFNAANTWSNITQNAYTRSSSTTRFGLSYRGLRSVLLRGGYDYYSYTRVDDLHLNTAQPDWTNAWVNGSYRPTRRWQVVAKANYRENPNPVTTNLDDPLPLVMNLDRNAELRIQGTPIDNAMVYLGSASRFRRNTRRNIDLREDTASVGGWLQVSPRLSLNVDYSLLRMDSRNLVLQGMLSDAYVTTLGGSLGLPRGMNLDASYSNYRAANAQNIAQDVWGLNLHRALSASTSWNLELRRDDYRDRATPTQSYKANVVSVGGQARF